MGVVTVIGTSWAASTGSTFTVDWADVARAARYDVYVTDEPSTIWDMTVPTMAVTGSKTTITGLKPTTKYAVRVVPANNKGTGKPSARVIYTTPRTEIANLAWHTAKPADTSAVSFVGTSWAEDTGITLSADWADTPRATGYEVYVSSDIGGIYDMTTPTMVVTTSKFTVKGLKEKTRYGVRVAAINNMGRAAYAPRVDFTTLTAETSNLPWKTVEPGDAGLVSFVGKSLTSTGATLSIDWADVKNATAYEVYAATGYDAVAKMTTPTLTVTASKATLTRLQKNTDYFVRVVPLNSAGRGQTSHRAGHQTISAEGSGGQNYSLLTWNVCSNVCGDFAGRKSIIDARIRELGPDIVGLQEAHAYTSAPSGYTFAHNGQNDILIRNGVFTKVRPKSGVATSGATRFSSKHYGAGQGLSWAALRHSSGAHVIAVSLHLVVGNSAAQMKQRQYEAERAVSYATSMRTKLAKTYGSAMKNAAIIFTGDFNTSKATSGDTTTALLQKMGWYDAFDQARSLSGQLRNTANPGMKSSITYSGRWGAPIDKVLVEPTRTTITSWTHAGKIVGGKYATPLGSDHHPVLVKGNFGGTLVPTKLPAGVSRIQGTNRYGTSANVSRTTFSSGVPVAYIASGANFPDALAGAAAAGIKGAPVLLTPPTGLSDEVRAELKRLQPQHIKVLGGPGAVRYTVLTQARDYTAGTVERIYGANRYETSAAVSRATFPKGADVAYLAAGADFPDALSGAAAAAQRGGPVLLTAKDAIPPSVKKELTILKPREIVILGGPGAVSDKVLTAAKALAPTVTRADGLNRYATSAAISQDTFAAGVPVAYVAVGTAFPDALSGAAAAGVSGGPVLLVGASTIPSEVKAELKRLKPKKIVVLGGPGAVDDMVAVDLGDYVVQ
ncbi:cell wall-binding repeat-containing protein [Microbacterium sp. MC2]